MIFPENYYQLEEVFKIDGSGQQCMVVAPPVRKADNMWSVIVRLVDNDYREVLDVTACQPGCRLLHPKVSDNFDKKNFNCWKPQ
nr:MAG TPA: hypothetical protein [Crassvirales sp.]